jgi:hypothetical protein
MDFNRTGNFKADIPQVTVVLKIRENRVDMLNTLIDTFAIELPDDLVFLLRDVQRQMAARYQPYTGSSDGS